MKPRIKQIDGMWICGVVGMLRMRCGVGYTPLQAWQDWKAQQ